MKYITIPEPFSVYDPNTGKITSLPRSPFIDGVRMALVSIFQKGAQRGAPRVDQSKLDDLTELFEAAEPGQIVPLSDELHRLLADEFKAPDPTVFGAGWAFSSRKHRKAILDAPDSKPAHANGADHTKVPE